MVTIRTRTGELRSLPESAISALAAAMRGRLIQPDDAGYDAARQVWNATIDRRPALIAALRAPPGEASSAPKRV